MKRILLAGLFLGIFAVPISAGSGGPSAFVPIVSDSAVQDTSRWELWQDNMGRFVRPILNGPGGFWPKRTIMNYIYGAGLWVGVLDSLRTLGDTAVSWSYNPNSGQSEFGPCTPDGDHNRYLDSLARMYDSRNPQDTAQWPERDSLGRAIMTSDQELWTICNDLNPLFMVAPDSAIGIQVIRRAFAWNSPGLWKDIVKMEFDVKNVTGRWGGNPHTLQKVILGVCMDADIGNENGTAANDLCAFDYPHGLGIQYQTVQEPRWGPPPYYMGIKLVEGPINNTGDTLRIRSDTALGYSQYDHDILPGQPLGITAFQVFTISTDPSTASARYLELTGRYYLTPYVYNAYQRDVFGPDDKRFLLCCGPINLPNDTTAGFVIHIIGASDSLDLIRKAELLGVESPPGPVSRSSSGVVLYPSLPTPTSGSCVIRYALVNPSQVSLRVYDVSGRLVRELDKGERLAGSHAVRWDGRDRFGRAVSNGVYFYRLDAGGFTKTNKLVVVR